ncbi:MAG: Sensor protein ZraS [Deltaproteobacteria bacterium ADurb.Bin072]|nr:MAG: Sensor protein ZraS [Deltaproteobacteria bacterium ADurb.Bin072]
MDTGPGISKNIKDRMFEPYFSTKKGGTGLGLVIVSRIIADHNGFIRVRDNEPAGTIFSIELPVKE